MLIFLYIIIFLSGLCFGSFANVLIYRLPINKSVISPGSKCPFCKKNIKWYDNIPVISFLVLKGKCRYCSQKISFRYPAVELFMGFMFFFIAFRMLNGLSLWMLDYNFFIKLIFYSLFSFTLIVIGIIDFENMIIPDSLSVLLIILGVLFAVFDFSRDIGLILRLEKSILAGIVIFLIFYFLAFFSEKFFRREALGGGDIKMVAGLGAFLGLKNVFMVVFIGSILTVVFALILLIFNIFKKNKNYNFQYPLPYGPFLSLGALIILLK